jgi:anti-sigma-K factor RskA
VRDHQQIADDLVLYALHELPEERRSEVRRHLENCSECSRELSEITSGLAMLALSAVGSAPPQRTRARLIQAIQSEPRAPRSFVMRRPWWSFVPSFAAVLLAVFGLMLWRENTVLKRKLDASQQQVDLRQAALDRSQMVLEALTSPESAHFALVSTKSLPVPEGKASYVRRTGTLVFTAQHLEALPPQKIYQLWLIPTNGSAPMACGTFRPDAHGNASIVMPNAEKNAWPKMFAVTVEPEGGSQTPTMPIVMAGA